MQQAKINVQDNEKYKEANEILHRHGILQSWDPRGPIEWQVSQYKRKGTWIGVGTLISAVGLSQAILAWDWIALVSYIIIILFGLIFGILQMNVAETYWTEEYYDYAKMVEKEAQVDKDEFID